MKSAWTLGAFAALMASSTMALAVEASPAMSRGAPKGITEPFYRCTHEAAGDMVGLGQCATAERKVQDKRLNDAYAALMGKLDENGKAHLRAAERAWIEFNARSVDTELDVRKDEKTANIDASINEVYRYAELANRLEGLLSIAGE